MRLGELITGVACSTLLIGLLCCGTPAQAEDAAERFTRIRKNDAGTALAVETSIATYELPGGATVDLISAIHVGEKRYYQELNRRFAGYDAVLYELIAPKGFRLTKDRPDSAVSSVQREIQELLDLSYQLDEIDYGAKNFVHADVSPDEFFHDLTSSRFSVWETLESLIAASSAQRKKRDPVQDLKAMIVMFQSKSQTRTFQLRSYLAEQFQDADEMVKRLEGVIGDAIVSKRNSRAIAVLQREIRSGKKHLAIFYGAAHMPDMARKLHVAAQAAPAHVEWFCAWRLTPDADGNCSGLSPASAGEKSASAADTGQRGETP